MELGSSQLKAMETASSLLSALHLLTARKSQTVLQTGTMSSDKRAVTGSKRTKTPKFYRTFSKTVEPLLKMKQTSRDTYGRSDRQLESSSPGVMVLPPTPWVQYAREPLCKLSTQYLEMEFPNLKSLQNFSSSPRQESVRDRPSSFTTMG